MTRTSLLAAAVAASYGLLQETVAAKTVTLDDPIASAPVRTAAAIAGPRQGNRAAPDAEPVEMDPVRREGQECTRRGLSGVDVTYCSPAEPATD